jgi:hypothetical protein
MRPHQDDGMKVFWELAESMGYSEGEQVRLARHKLEAVLIHQPSSSHASLDHGKGLRHYNRTAKLEGRTTASQRLACIAWIGSRILLARTYFGFNLFSQAAEAMNEAAQAIHILAKVHIGSALKLRAIEGVRDVLILIAALPKRA